MTLPEALPSRRRFLRGAIAASVALTIPIPLLALSPSTTEVPVPKSGARLAVGLTHQLRYEQAMRCLARRVSYVVQEPGIYGVDDPQGLVLTGPIDVDALRSTVRISAPYSSTSNVSKFIRAARSLRDELISTETDRFLARVTERTTATHEAKTLSDVIDAHPTSGYVVMHPRDYHDHFPWMREQNELHTVDFETHRELLTTGVMAYYRGAEVCVSHRVPKGQVYSFGEHSALIQEHSPISVQIDLIEGSGSPDKFHVHVRQETSTALGEDIRGFKLA